MEIFSLMAGISRTASISGMAARRIWQPAFSSATACRTLPSISVEGTFSMDCTVTGAPPPIFTLPAMTCFEMRFIVSSFPLSACCDAHDVLERDGEHQADKQCKAACVHPAFVLCRNRPAEDCFDDEEHEPSAVERRQRQ